MCGRVRTPEEINQIKIELTIKHDRLNNYTPRWNVPPTSQLPVITSSDGERTLQWMRWGLIPAFIADIKKVGSTFNARAETVATKNSFRNAWKAGRRCLVVTSGFYEWSQSTKQPYAVALGNLQPMYMAGLWEEWRPKDCDPITSCTIITTEANPKMEPIHDRMPVIVDPDDFSKWLGEEPCDPASLLKPFDESRLAIWTVGKSVGNVRNQGGKELAEPVAVA